MTIKPSLLLPSISLCVALLALAACACPGCDAPPANAAAPTQVSYPVDNTVSSPPTGASWSSSFYHMAPSAPPAPRYEEAPVPDNIRAYAWRPGYWNYSGSDFYWVSGEMMDRPDPTALWSPDHWIQHTYGWALVPGYWQ